jgi:hypothetical protein
MYRILYFKIVVLIYRVFVRDYSRYFDVLLRPLTKNKTTLDQRDSKLSYDFYSRSEYIFKMAKKKVERRVLEVFIRVRLTIFIIYFSIIIIIINYALFYYCRLVSFRIRELWHLYGILRVGPSPRCPPIEICWRQADFS